MRNKGEDKSPLIPIYLAGRIHQTRVITCNGGLRRHLTSVLRVNLKATMSQILGRPRAR